MAEVHSFPALAAADARFLILGSMPGKASLQANEYYAHPRNMFWPILGELLGALPSLSYQERCRILTTKHIAVWDVLKSCHRPGSLDADIDPDSITANDFTSFFAGHPHISHVYFNGETAEKTFRKHVIKHIHADTLQFQRLPSTSPAHAALNFQQKLARWSVILQHQQ